jgi:hypothetical protein
LATLYVLYLFMAYPLLSGSAGRFAMITSALCRAVMACLVRGGMDVAMMVLVWARLRRVERLLVALSAWVHDARHVVRQSVGPAIVAPPPGASVETRAGLARDVEGIKGGGDRREFAWLVPLVPQRADTSDIAPEDSDDAVRSGYALIGSAMADWLVSIWWLGGGLGEIKILFANRNAQ